MSSHYGKGERLTSLSILISVSAVVYAFTASKCFFNSWISRRTYTLSDEEVASTSFSSRAFRLLISILSSSSLILSVKFSTEPVSLLGHRSIALRMASFNSFSVD